MWIKVDLTDEDAGEQRKIWDICSADCKSLLCKWLKYAINMACYNVARAAKIFSFLGACETGKYFLRDESIVYNSLYTIYKGSAALSVEKIHW